jgi:anti-sigma regulatory factor (Ser/Thr protein kinase)
MPDLSFRDTFSTPEEMRLVLRNVLSTARSQLPIEEETWYDLKIILHELCGNALEHGKCPVEVFAAVCRGDLCLHVLVYDSGEGFYPQDCMLSNVEEERGRGLHIVNSLADDLIFNSAANKVLVKLHISPA